MEKENMQNTSCSGLLKIRKRAPGQDPIDWPSITIFNLTIAKIGDLWVANGTTDRCSLDLEYNVANKNLRLTLTETPKVFHKWDYIVDSRWQIESDEKSLYIKWQVNVESNRPQTHHNIMASSSLLLKTI